MISEAQSSRSCVQIPRRWPRRQRRDRERLFQTARIALFYLASPLPLAWRLLPYGLSVTSLPVGQALSDDAFNGPRGSLYVIYAEPGAVAIAEIKFRQVTVQVLFFAMLVGAAHAAFENRKIAFNSVGADRPARIFLCRVVDGFVARKFAAQFHIVSAFIGHHRSFAVYVFSHYRRDLPDARGIDMEATRASAALYESEDHVFVSPSGSALGLPFKAADEGLIHFYDFASAAHWSHTDNTHGLTDAVSHEPCGLEGHAQGAGKLVAADALFAGAEQVHRLKPQVHRNVAVLENGTHFDRELLPALVALVEADPSRLTGHLADAFDTPAMRTNRAFRPYAGFNPSDSGGFVLEDFGGQDRIGHNTVFLFIINRIMAIWVCKVQYPPAERARQLFNYDPETGDLRWRPRSVEMFGNSRRSAARACSTWNKRFAGNLVGRVNEKGYRIVEIDSISYRAHRIAWLIVHGKWPTDQLDHRHGKRDHNPISELREATPGEQQQNKKKVRTNTSGYTGVSWHKQTRRWAAYISVNRKHIFLGLFDAPKEASEVYLKAKQEYHPFQPTPRDT